jgi:hypothetical protein
LGSIIEILEALEKGPMFHYEFNPDAYMQVIFVLHELTDLCILDSKLEKGKNKGGYDNRFYLTDTGKNLLNQCRVKREYATKK